MSADGLDSGKVDWIWDGRLAQMGYTQSDLSTLARVLLRTCPHCGAEPGAYCVNTSSGVLLEGLDTQHVSRRTMPDHA